MFTQMHREIQALKDHLLALGAEVERSITDTEKCVMNLDIELAKQVIEYDKTIDQHEVDIEEECLKIMALYHPVAMDLRYVVAVLKMNNDLERVGDLCKNIAEYVLEIAKGPSIDIPPDFATMFAEAHRLVRESLDSLVKGDLDKARQVCADDQIVDDLNAQIINEIRDRIHAQPEKIDSLLFLISVSRSIERIADYATNIAEEVVYSVNGKIVRHADISVLDEAVAGAADGQ